MTEHDPLAGSDTYDVLSGLPQKQGERMSSLVDRLRAIGRKKVGDPLGPELPDDDWGTPLAALLNEAADRIECLEARGGAVSQGSGSFRDIARDLPRNEPKPLGPYKGD